jgi:hypothetical protein
MMVALYVVPSFWEQLLSHLSVLVLLLSLFMPAVVTVLYKRKHWRKLIAVVVMVVFEIFTVIVVFAQMSNGMLLNGYIYMFFGKVIFWILCFKDMGLLKELRKVKQVDSKKPLS